MNRAEGSMNTISSMQMQEETHIYPRFLTLTRTHQSRAITSEESVLSYSSPQPAEALQLKNIFSIFISQESTTGSLNMLRKFLKDSLLEKEDTCSKQTTHVP